MGPIPKRRKVEQPAELTFDPAARNDYLTGFHKRKLQRIKHAQEQAAKELREERVKERRQLREQRKVDLERHVAETDALMRQANPDISDAPSDAEQDSDIGEWNGIEEPSRIDATDEYVDEDKYTTVTIEAMDDPQDVHDDGDKAGPMKETADGAEQKEGDEQRKGKREWTKNKPAGIKKKKKPKFRYESKAERKAGRQKQKSKNSAAAKERRAK